MTPIVRAMFTSSKAEDGDDSANISGGAKRPELWRIRFESGIRYEIFIGQKRSDHHESWHLTVALEK